jgi:integrase
MGDCVMILATAALRISEVAGLQVGDVDLLRGLLTVRRQTYPGRGGLVTKETKGRRRRLVPIIEPRRATFGATDRRQGQGCSSAGWSSWRGDHDRDPARCDGGGTSWLMILGCPGPCGTVCETRR